MHRWIYKEKCVFISNLKTRERAFHSLVDELGKVLVSHLFDSALTMVELEDQKLGTRLKLLSSTAVSRLNHTYV